MQSQTDFEYRRGGGAFVDGLYFPPQDALGERVDLEGELEAGYPKMTRLKRKLTRHVS